MRIRVQLAHTKDEYESAFTLLQKGRKNLGLPTPPGDLWVTKQHALPSTNTFVALDGHKVVGAISLFGESAFRLPLEEQADLTAFRANLAGRIAEFSVAGFECPVAHEKDVLLALYHFGLCFGSSYCHYDAFITQAPWEWADRFREVLQYEPLLLKEKVPGLTLFRSAREGADFRREFSPDFSAEFRFPEKKFFLVAHQSIEASTLDYLFNGRTDLFTRLSDLEIRVLKNIYDHGEFACIMPDRKLTLPFKQLPKHRRFPMNCDGYLCRADGRRINLQVIDVSREGIKIRASDPLPRGDYPLTLQIGVMKQSEIIARTVWVDEEAHISGLVVKSGDKKWAQLIEYLEREHLSLAA